MEKNKTPKELPHLDWIMAAKEGDEEALQKIITQYSGICVAAYQGIVKQKFSPNSRNIPSIECDTLSDRNLIIYEAVNSYKPDKNTKFSSWLYDCMKYRCFKGLSDSSKNPTLPDFDQITFLKEIEGLEKENQVKEVAENMEDLKKVLEFLDTVGNKTFKGADKAKEVVKLRYFSGTRKPVPYKVIAEKFGVNTQTALNWHNKLIQYVKNKMVKQKI